jgi:organic radical activating enzyme/glycosyltransferase involved in cell wall biosynthesis
MYTITKITDSFKSLNFDDYQIVAVNSGMDEPDMVEISMVHENVIIHNTPNRLYPGIARNFGIENSSSKWIWFVDDDDDLNDENIQHIISSIHNDNNIDVIAHSLKLQYTNNIRTDLVTNIVTFKEKQEVFNYLFKRDLISTKFSDGIHEDIRYITEILLASTNIQILNSKIYNKIQRNDSITKELTNYRIDGYLRAITEIVNIDNPIIVELRNDIVTQCLGVILYLINNSNDDSKLQFINHLETELSIELRNLITKRYNKNNTNFKYAVSLFLNSKDDNQLISDLDYCFKTYLSCSDLKNSIFFGPEEIIGCCKRFFYKGKLKGDIVLMPNSTDITLDTILDRKKEVEHLINIDKFEDCEGCPYLQRFDKKDDEKIKYISLENFTYCNMKCSYCSPKYYGGREPSYDTDSIISDLISGDYLENTHIVWGGGEPTLKPKFDTITKNLLDSERVSKIRVLTNSLKFSEKLNEIASNEKIRIVTSIDAGTQFMFKEIRGRGDIHTVLDNLKIYKQSIDAQENLTIKYILTEDNYLSNELTEFVNLIKEYEFQDNFIQISCNFKIETPTDDMIYAIYELAGRLLTNGFKFVYVDDLIRDRLKISNKMADNILSNLKDNNIIHKNILSHYSSETVILWGDGYQSKWIKNKTLFGKAGKVIKIITNENELTDLDILNENIIICPAAIQSLPEIYKQIKKSNVLHKVVFGIFI